MTRHSAQKDLSKSTTRTRKRLLEAAMDVFGRYGYDAATTRRIASEAGVNIAAIPYYFTGKEGLYTAVVYHTVGLIADQIDRVRQEVTKESCSGPLSKEQATDLLEKFVVQLITFMVGSPEAPRVARIILREQMYPTAAYDIIYTGFMSSALDAVSQLLMVISGNSCKRTATLRAMAIIGQILAFRVARETVVRALEMDGYNLNETEEIREIIIEHTRSILNRLADSDTSSVEENQ